MTAMNETMQKAMRLMQNGDLQAATRTLQQRLGGDVHAGNQVLNAAPVKAWGRAVTPSDLENCIDAEFRVVDSDEPSAESRKKPVDGVDSPFTQKQFSCSAGALDYKLYMPAEARGRSAPLLVMLHGCTQSADDFAVGTRMNQHAREHGYVVAYPQQSMARNQNRCWNWFQGADQQRDRGEPAMLAALARHLVTQHGLDPSRVYVAGLSAGGAMAAVLANTHPDIFAAIGVHSGLPIGLASDMPSAFAAMRTGQAKRPRRNVEPKEILVPAIVFHGDADKTVHSRNGAGVIAQSIGAVVARDSGAIREQVEIGVADGGRRYTRTRHLNDGELSAEHWVIHGAAHAWSGGDCAGTYTDPTGPDASAQMLQFFNSCVLATHARV